MHSNDYSRYLQLKEKSDDRRAERMHSTQHQTGKQSNFSQTDLDEIVLNFMISNMHPPTLLEDESFEILVNGNELVKFYFILTIFMEKCISLYIPMKYIF